MGIGNGVNRANSSIWELTISERNNASNFILHSTAKPFYYCRAFFKCFFCHETYFDITKLLVHTSTHDIPDQTKILTELLKKGNRTLKVDISNLKCRICQKELPELESTRQHLISEHNVTFTESGNGVVGFNLTTKNGLFLCHYCDKTFQTFILLNRHMNEHFSNFVCEICGAGFISHQRILNHKQIHQPGGYPCDQCTKVYTTSSNLKFHIERDHVGNRKMRMLRCPDCGERFTEHFKKLKHLKDVHGITFTYECDICKSTFSSRRALTSHNNKTHSDKTQCQICKKCFNNTSALKEHMNCHSELRTHVCDICQRAYRHKRGLRFHMKTHVNGDAVKFTCPECGNGFTNRIEFNKHVKEWHPKSYYEQG